MSITEASIRGDTLVYWKVDEATNEWHTEGLIKLAAIAWLDIERTNLGHGLGAKPVILLHLHSSERRLLSLEFSEPDGDTEECSNVYDIANKLFSVLTSDVTANDRPVA